jgi:hypothetical protein
MVIAAAAMAIVGGLLLRLVYPVIVLRLAQQDRSPTPFWPLIIKVF